jgi:D-3-phosphoglycerate dehydrogenase / 2-oxoglutarate reductase
MNDRVYVALSQFCEDDDRPRRVLQDAGFLVEENRTGRRLRGEELVSAAGAPVAIIAGVEPYSADTLAALPGLRCISRVGIGTDAIDVEAARRLGIGILTTPDEITEPVSQLTVSLILALARNLPEAAASMRNGDWTRRTGVLLSEWTIGLVGFGRIGRAVEQCLRPFGSRLIAADPAMKQEDLPANVELMDLGTLLARSDVVSLHVSRPESEGPLLRRPELLRMKEGARLVNTARGYLVDEAALFGALVGGHLSGAALDVYQDEPYSGPLTTLPQVLCTPHIGTLTRASRRAMELKAASNVVDFLQHPS